MKPKKLLAVLLSILLIFGTVLAGCSAGGPKFGKIDNTKWKYNELSDSYYQTELVYCKKPTDTAIQSLAVFVPAKYVNPVANGNGTSKVAKQWRIRSGISQGDTALCTEVNLALALKNTGATVDFEENWGIGNVLYEYGDSPALSNADWISQNK